MAQVYSITLTGDKALMRKLKRFPDAARKGLADGTLEAAESIMRDSKENYVPVLDGILRGSGHVQPPKYDNRGVSVVLGFGGPAAVYALKVHENPRAGKTGGISPSGKRYQRWATTGQWKYLETPMKAWASRIPKFLRRALKRQLQRLARGA